MDDPKKQKLVLAVLAVLALGWGGYYFLFRDSGGSANKVQRTGPVGRKKRATSDSDAKATKGRKTRVKSREARVRPAGRKVREETERRVSKGRKTRRGKKKEVKKKKIVPAA